MTKTGPTMWTIRNQLQSEDSGSEHGIAIPIVRPNQKTAKPNMVRVLWQTSAFEHHETEKGMDKIVENNYSRSPLIHQSKRARQPLTVCTGKDWDVQRPIVCGALANVPKLSLRATEHINWRTALQSAAIQGNTSKSFERDMPSSSSSSSSLQPLTVDLKQVVLEAAEEWNRRLFVGTSHTLTSSEEYQTLFRNAVMLHWTHSRAIVKDRALMRQSLEELEAVLPWNHFGNGKGEWEYPQHGNSGKKEAEKNIKGILQSLYESRLTPHQATDNAINAIIASLDAVQALVFWTLWNLSRLPGAWERCQNTSEDQVKKDLLQLSLFKKQATQGKPIQLDGKKVSFLACSLLETVRVYPPVWTLPRNWYNPNEAKACKFDVLLCNQGTDQQWDPLALMNGSNARNNITIASFGLGRRHCPAGTGGLYAAYELIRSFVATCTSIEECQRDQALNYSFLGPTLCVHGPQLFRVVLQTDDEIIEEEEEEAASNSHD